jgi:predicted Rossmann-fold nucleotide-binding protein
MKPVINSSNEVTSWLANPVPAVFKGQDLLALSDSIASQPLIDCTFLGCHMNERLKTACAVAGCLVIPSKAGLSFNPFSPGLYTPAELYNQFNPDAADPISTYKQCLDWLIYNSVIDPLTKKERPADIDDILMRRIHDSSMTDSLNELLDQKDRAKCVAIMGGHDRGRNEDAYKKTAKLALDLTKAGYYVVTGGGPGLMEAGNLGAYVSGFADPETVLTQALSSLSVAPLYNDPNWLKVGFKTWTGMGVPTDFEKSRSLGIPTWFYGHEPPNVFATDIAKYFENSVREEGLLAVSQGGIIYAEGNGGTVQEIFQDANQNYYRTYGQCKSPMILFNTDYWNPAAVNFNNPTDKRKQAYLLLHKLATEKKFDDYLYLSDDPVAVVKFIKEHPPIA